MFRVICTSDFDLIKKKTMIEKRCFNCNEKIHHQRLFIIKNNQNERSCEKKEISKNFEKKIIFIKIAIEKMITMSFMNLNLFDSNFTIVKCILKNK